MLRMSRWSLGVSRVIILVPIHFCRIRNRIGKPIIINCNLVASEVWDVMMIV